MQSGLGGSVGGPVGGVNSKHGLDSNPPTYYYPASVAAAPRQGWRGGLFAPCHLALMNRRSLSPPWLLSVLTGLNLLNYLDRNVLNAVRTPLATDLGLSYGDSGR